MYCNRCGEEIDDDSRFCKSCGMQIPTKPAAIPPESAGEDSTPEAPQPRMDYFHRHVPKQEPRERRRLSDYGHLWGILLLVIVVLLFWWLR